MRRRSTAEGSSRRIHDIVFEVEELHDDEGVDTSLYVVEGTEGGTQVSNQNENLTRVRVSSQETVSQDQDLSEPTDREKLEMQQFAETMQRKMTALQQHFYKKKEVGSSSSGASASDAENHQERASVHGSFEEAASRHLASLGGNTDDSSGHGSFERDAAMEEAASGLPSLG